MHLLPTHGCVSFSLQVVAADCSHLIFSHFLSNQQPFIYLLLVLQCTWQWQVTLYSAPTHLPRPLPVCSVCLIGLQRWSVSEIFSKDCCQDIYRFPTVYSPGLLSPRKLSPTCMFTCQTLWTVTKIYKPPPHYDKSLGVWHCNPHLN